MLTSKNRVNMLEFKMEEKGIKMYHKNAKNNGKGIFTPQFIKIIYYSFLSEYF